MESVLPQIGEFAVSAIIFLGWWFAISVLAALCWSLFHLRLNRGRAPRPALTGARMPLVVPRPMRAPAFEQLPARLAA